MSYLGSILSSISNSKPEHHVPHLSSTALQGQRRPVEAPRRDDEPAKLAKPLSKSSASNGSTPSHGIDSSRIRPSTSRSNRPSSSTSTSAHRATSMPPGNPPPEPKIPKKGSYAEIMARAKQAPLAKPVGIIKHKPKEKLSSKKEALIAKELAKRKKQGKHVEPKTSKESPLARDPKAKSAAKGTEKAAKSVAYTGTMKPKAQTTYKGTMKPASLSSTRHAHPTSSDRRARPSSPADSSEESDDASISEDYSDMEAGFDDVEEEDERAAREARREDEYEKRKLDELKWQKEARKQKSR